MKVLVTGGSGFVGGAVIRAISKSHDVYYSTRSGHLNLEASPLEISDISCKTDWGLKGRDFDVVVHCAAVVDSRFKESEIYRVNVEGSINLAKQAYEAGVRRMIFVSSIKVNGETTTGRSPFTVSDPVLPEDAYGKSKFKAEQLLIDACQRNGMEYTIIRPPLVYGLGVRANFRSLVLAVQRKLPLPLRSVKANYRSLVSVTNLVSLIEVCISNPAAANEIFLVSDGQDVSTAKLIQMISEASGIRNYSLPVPVFVLRFLGLLCRRQALVDRLLGDLRVDIEHTKKTLKWEPSNAMEEELELMATAIRSSNLRG